MKAVPLNDGNSYIIPIGKYKGQNIMDIFEEDRGYVEWIYDNVDFKSSYPQFYNIVENLVSTGCPF